MCDFTGRNIGIQNSETGEVDYVCAEPVAITLRHIKFDEETGEPECSKVAFRYHKKKSFQIPRKYLRNLEEDNDDEPSCSTKSAEYNPFDKEAFINMECVNKDIVLGFSKTKTHLLFLIPSLFWFTKLTSIVIIFCEFLLHYLAHCKNAKNPNSNTFYRSPLHRLTSQFCGHCRAESEMDSISKHHRLSSSSININFKDMPLSLLHNLG